MTTLDQGELRPSAQPEDRQPLAVPLLRPRRRDRPVIAPEDCLVADCPVCRWRLAGLLDVEDDGR